MRRKGGGHATFEYGSSFHKQQIRMLAEAREPQINTGTDGHHFGTCRTRACFCRSVHPQTRIWQSSAHQPKGLKASTSRVDASTFQVSLQLEPSFRASSSTGHEAEAVLRWQRTAVFFQESPRFFFRARLSLSPVQRVWHSHCAVLTHLQVAAWPPCGVFLCGAWTSLQGPDLVTRVTFQSLPKKVTHLSAHLCGWRLLP